MLFSFIILTTIIPFVINQGNFGQGFDLNSMLFPEYDDYSNRDGSDETNQNNEQRVIQPLVQPTTAKPPFISNVGAPGSATQPSRCENRCQITPQYNPVCGTNELTYANPARLLCAQACGINVRLSHHGVCASSLNF